MAETFEFVKKDAKTVTVTKTVSQDLTRPQLMQELLTIEQNLTQHGESITILTARKADITAALAELDK